MSSPLPTPLLKYGTQQSVNYRLLDRDGVWGAWEKYQCFALMFREIGLEAHSKWNNLTQTYDRKPVEADGDFRAKGIRLKVRNNYVRSEDSYKYMKEMVGVANWGVVDQEYREDTDTYVFELHPVYRSDWLRMFMFGTLSRYIWEYIEKIEEYIKIRPYVEVGHALVLMHFCQVRNTGHTLFSQSYKISTLKDFDWNKFLDTIPMMPVAWNQPIHNHIIGKWGHIFKEAGYQGQYPIPLNPQIYQKLLTDTIPEKSDGVPRYSPIQ